MIARGLRLGGRYLTLTGLPVQVAALRDGGMLLRSLASGNEFEAPGGYELRPMGQGTASLPLKAAAAGREPDKANGIARPKASNKPLAPLIDALLLAGNMTMAGMVRELRRKASAACRGRDVAANVRARLYWLRKRGCRVEISDQARMRAVAALH
ncbi:MAG: hypothetical protein HY922_09005 [Elusimicrobia bacterium]|nr:hypothetical protein [Elusimicrobiota bacterium]